MMERNKLSTTIAAILAMSGLTAQAADSDFVTMPLRLQDAAQVTEVTIKQPMQQTEREQRRITEGSIVGGGVKPNVLLLLDDSSSMTRKRTNKDPSRADIMRDVMSSVLDDQYKKVRFGVNYFKYDSQNAVVKDRGKSEIDTLKSALSNVVNNINNGYGGSTPTIKSYLEAAAELEKGRQYRCQNNYILLFTDGDSNSTFDAVRPPLRNGDWGSPKYNYLYGGFIAWPQINYVLNGGGDKAVKSFWDKAYRDYYPSDAAMSNDAYQAMCTRDYGVYKSQAQKYCNAIKATPNAIFYPYTGVSDSYFISKQALPVSGENVADNYNGALKGIEYLGHAEYGWPTKYSYDYFSRRYLDDYSSYMLSNLSRALDGNGVDLRTGGQDADGKSWDDPKFPHQTTKTITIAFGGGTSIHGQNMLEAGASSYTDAGGKSHRMYYSALDEAQLKKSLDEIFARINIDNPPPSSDPIKLPPVTDPIGSETSAPKAGGDGAQLAAVSSYAATAPGAIGQGSSKSVPNMAASIYLPPGLRSSELRFYELDGLGRLARDLGGNVIYKTPDFSGRKTLVSYRSGGHGQLQAGFVTGGSLPLSNTYFGLNPTSKAGNNEWRQALLPWIARSEDDATIRNKDYPTPYRVRDASERDMGDVIDTPVLPVGVAAAGEKKQPYLLTAANDGLVYIFKASGDNYALKLNYLPTSLPRENGQTIATALKDIADEKYTKDINNPHKFLLNGGLGWRTTDDSRPRQTFAIGAAGQGAKGIYALNIAGHKIDDSSSAVGVEADASQWENSVPLFEVGAGDDSENANLGYIVGTPIAARVSLNSTLATNQKLTDRNVRYAAIFGSGYGAKSDVDQEAALYVYDALGLDVGTEKDGGSMRTGTKSGDLIAKMPVIGAKGLSTPAVLDVDRDGIADYAFAGDYLGDLYRFDLRNLQNKSPNRVSKIYDGDPSQPITAAPVISRQAGGRYVVAFGTGSDLYGKDYPSAGKTLPQQAIYGIYQRFDKENLSVLNVEDAGTVSNVTPGYANRATTLLEQKFTTAETNYRTITNKSIFDSDNHLKYSGWFVPLGETDGERVVVSGDVLLGTLFISTRIYEYLDGKSASQYGAWDKDTWKDNHWTLISGPDVADRMEKPWSAWKIVGSSTETATDADQCNGKSTTETKVEERTRKTTYDEVTVYRQVKSSTVKNSGWILTLKAENGGALKVGASSSDLGVDFRRNLQGIYDGSTTASGQNFYAGQKFDGIPNAALVSANKTSLSVNAQNQVTETGEDKTLGKIPKPEPIDCLLGAVNFILPTDSATGLHDAFNLYAKQCKVGSSLIRLNINRVN